ncbi:DUF805 domain-containing protein [Microbacterium sp.]|uniref:DUF805 domain-containing protein n=1 Tax=Microbacterium sp. TaxID=51671 RepID=UPI003C74F795
MTTSIDAAPIEGASLPRAMERFCTHAFRLRGRASRSEYWWWMLTNLVVLAVTQLALPALIEGRTPQPTLYLGPFGSWLFAPIQVFTTQPTDAPSSALAAFFLIFAGIWMLVTAVPGFTVAVRRLHDSNLSGWWALLVLVPLGPFILLLLALRGSRPEGTRFDG